MTDISKHPLLAKCSEVIGAIEACGANEQLTAAVLAAMELQRDIETLVDSQPAQSATVEAEVIGRCVAAIDELRESTVMSKYATQAECNAARNALEVAAMVFAKAYTASQPAQAQCPICKDSGYYCTGTSGDDRDGNAPELERCDCKDERLAEMVAHLGTPEGQAAMKAALASAKKMADELAEARRINLADLHTPMGVQPAQPQAEAQAGETPKRRPCTCHPADNPPQPCEQKYALTECRTAKLERELQAANERERISADQIGYYNDALARADRTIADLRTQPAAQQADAWQPIETAPKDGRAFLVWRAHSTLPLIVKWDAAYDAAENEFGEHVYNLTHWMPLPDAPAGGKEQEAQHDD